VTFHSNAAAAHQMIRKKLETTRGGAVENVTRKGIGTEPRVSWVIP
jgi:hypothetical protein